MAGVHVSICGREGGCTEINKTIREDLSRIAKHQESLGNVAVISTACLLVCGQAGITRELPSNYLTNMVGQRMDDQGQPVGVKTESVAVQVSDGVFGKIALHDLPKITLS